MKLYAFWNYERFPYLLGGEAGEIKGNYVYPKSYGGCCFKVAFYLPAEHGEALKNELDSLKTEKREREKELNVEFKERLEKVLNTYPGAKVEY